MAVKATASDAAAAWASGFGAAGTKYTAGINAVTVAPGQLAANQKAAYLANVQASANIWASKVAAVDLGTWKTAATTTGASRLGSGATKGQPKVQAFMQNFIPQLSSIVGSLPARGTFDQNLSRFTAYAQALHAKKGSF
ncbi:MAG TPA: hypothetical protein VGG07_25200 [Solirubrobacteraceae bacterium]|jgi:hypothetical protein